MKIEKVNMLRVFLDGGDCNDNYEVTCEYKQDDEHLKQGNYFIEFHLNRQNCETRSHLYGTWIPSTPKTIEKDIIDWFNEYILYNIKEDIRFLEEEMEEDEKRFWEKIEAEKNNLTGVSK